METSQTATIAVSRAVLDQLVRVAINVGRGPGYSNGNAVILARRALQALERETAGTE